MDRPALKRLLADIEAGRVDCIVVYKVDRLSRSLMDFARKLEVFERKSIAFVSVTQQFNTTNSMGRLMLNVLLSFAQFEREIISERTRDKMAAARRKGKWVGGLAPIGYDIDPTARRLNVNEDEADRVRTIFGLYLECESIVTTLKELDRRDWRNKRSITKKGKERGGRFFDKSSLFKLLTNITYLGKIRYKEEIHQGEHQAIVPEDLWNSVNKKLKHNGKTGGIAVRNKFGALLKGLVHHYLQSDWHQEPRTARHERSYRGTSMTDTNIVDVQFHVQRRGKIKMLVEGKQSPKSRKPKGRLPRITRYMALAIYYEDLIRNGHVHDYAEIATLGHVTRARVTQIMNLRLLAPDLQESLLNLARIAIGRDGKSLRKLQEIALEANWSEQRKLWNNENLNHVQRR